MQFDPAIEQFFAERKEAWRQKNLKASMSEHEVQDVNRECDEVFALSNWLPNAAKRAGQISLSTHPCTFSHPSARKNKNGYVSSVIAEAPPAADGFLRTGNVEVEPDALGNAAALDVYKFLTLVMADEQTLLTHIQADTELAQSLLKTGGDIEQLREGFLAMITSQGDVVSSSKIKQVYFPVIDESGEVSYHLLSVLTHSGHLFELRRRLDKLRFSDEVKEKRELRRNNHYSDTGYQEIYNLTTIGYGGTKPQNISVLNNQNAGKAHLLLSVPPELSYRHVRLPKQDFFSDVLYPKALRSTMMTFAKFLQIQKNNVDIRDMRAPIIQEYVDAVIQKMWQIRQAYVEQPYSRSDTLPLYQRIWLFPEYEEQRVEEDDWSAHLLKDIARYFFQYFEKVVGEKAIQLGDAEYDAVKKVVDENREAFL